MDQYKLLRPQPKFPPNQYPPLVKAAHENDLKTLNQLIYADVDLNEKDSEGLTALLHAVWQGNAESVKVLLLHGADRTIPDSSEFTTLLYALLYDRKACVQVLLSGMEGDPAFRSYVNYAGFEGMRSLQIAARTWPVETVRLILDAGAKIDGVNGYGYQAIHVAATRSLPGVIQLLVDRGANVHARTSQEEVPLYFAALHVHLDAASSLLANNADVNALTGGHQDTPLIAASMLLNDDFRNKTSAVLEKKLFRSDAVNIIRFFLEFPEININYQNGRGMNALLFSVLERGCSEAVELFLKAGAFCGLPDAGGRLPIDVAADAKIRDLLKFYSSPSDVIGYDVNASPSSVLVGYVRQKRELVDHRKGASITSGSSKHQGQNPVISLHIPENALPRPLAFSLTPTPNPPVHRVNHRLLSTSSKEVSLLPAGRTPKKNYVPRDEAIKSKKILKKIHSSKLVAFASAGNELKYRAAGDIALCESSHPIPDLSPQSTTISSFVTVNASEPVVMTKDAVITIPHSARSREKQTTYKIIVHEQSLGPEGKLNSWKRIHEGKVHCTKEAEVTVKISQFMHSTTYVALAESTNKKPVKESIQKELSFWMLGSPFLQIRMKVLAVCCCNAYRPDKLLARMDDKFGTEKRLVPWDEVPYNIVASSSVTVVMSAVVDEWQFLPPEKTVDQDVLTVDAIHHVNFLLSCKEKSAGDGTVCCCTLRFDDKTDKNFFFTPGNKKENSGQQGSTGSTLGSTEAQASALLGSPKEDCRFAKKRAVVHQEGPEELDADFPSESSKVTRKLVLSVASLAGRRWEDIAIELLPVNEVDEIEGKSNKIRMIKAINAWINRSEKPTVGALLVACKRGGLSKNNVEEEYSSRL
eukprot:m.192009 g.192009  ORF g.192009 m.192009 type:complete len:869 (+) comp39461_c0_seq6:79-2685(+)